MATVPKSSETGYLNKMVEDILSGNYQNYLNLKDFNKFLKQFLFEETFCKESKQENDLFDPNCLMDKSKPMFKFMLLELFIKNDSLQYVWNFCREFLVLQKNSTSEETLKKLLQLQSDFIGLYSSKNSNKSYIFTKNDSDTINSYYAFVTEFFQIPNFTQVKIQYFSGQEAFSHAKSLLKSLIRFAPNQSQIFSHLNSTPRYPHDIKSPFQNFMSGSGKLALQLRANNESFNFLEDAAKELTDVATDKLNSTTLKEIRSNFVNEYCKGYSEIDETCQQVFNTVECYPSALENTHFTFIYKMLTSIGLGAFSGFLNGGSQIILHIAEQKNCSLPTQRLLAVTLALASSLAISTLPLIYSIVENLANDETDSLVNSEKLLTCTYAFITSIVLQGMNARVNYILPKKTLLKNLLSMLPLFAGLWMLANSDDSILEYISVLAANIITALATSSSLTYFGLKRFSVNRSNDLVEKANENKTFEMEKLKEEKENNCDAISEIEKNLTPEEIFFEKNKFISSKNLDKMAKYLKEIINDTQAFSDMQILQPSKELLQTRLTALKNLHAGLISKDFIKLPKDKTPENVEIQFKSNCESLKFLIESINKELQTSHFFNEDRNLKADLNKIEGLDSKNHTPEFKSKLGKIKDNIGFIDTIIKGAFSLNDKNVSNSKSQSNRRNTIYLFSNRSSSSSDENRLSMVSSSGESSKSDGYGNTTFNDPKELEVQSLLQTRLNR